MNKLEALLGFAVRSGKIVFGFDNLCETTKKVKVVVCSPSTNDKVKQKLKSLCDYKKWVLVETEELLEDLIHRDNCKVVGLLDKGMAQAVLNIENLKVITRE